MNSFRDQRFSPKYIFSALGGVTLPLTRAVLREQPIQLTTSSVDAYLGASFQYRTPFASFGVSFVSWLSSAPSVSRQDISLRSALWMQTQLNPTFGLRLNLPLRVDVWQSETAVSLPLSIALVARLSDSSDFFVQTGTTIGRSFFGQVSHFRFVLGYGVEL